MTFESHGGLFIHIIGCSLVKNWCFLKRWFAGPAHPGSLASETDPCWWLLECAWQMQGDWGAGIMYSFCLAWARAFKVQSLPGATSFHIQFLRALARLFSAIPSLHPFCGFFHPSCWLRIFSVRRLTVLQPVARSHPTLQGTWLFGGFLSDH